MTKKIPKADIDFERDLWKAADELRGAVAENQYKDYVLSLIFIKHLSERYEIRKDELRNDLEDPQSGYYTTDLVEISYVLEDPDEYLSRNILIVPKEASWQYLQDNAEQDDIKVKVDDALDKLQEVLDTYKPGNPDLLPRIFVKSQLTARQVGGLINLFSQKKFSEKENPESDILGRIYEYYLGKFAMAEGSGAGQFFTPGSIVRLLVEMLEPYKGRIFDPACGSGGMFVQSMKFIKAHGGNVGNISVYGQERYDGSLRLCKMNLILRDLPFDIRLGNSLLDDKFPDLKADYVIANPPFNVDTWHPEDLPEHDPRLLGPREEFTTDGNANYMWMQTFWHHLSDRGTAGYVMANGAMTTNNKGEKNVRQKMVDEGMVDCIVRLPDKLFMTTGIPACLFFLSKDRDGHGEHRERKNEILFIDASKLGEMATRRLRVFSDDDITKIANTYHLWRNSPPQENSPLEGGKGGVISQEGNTSGNNSLLEEGTSTGVNPPLRGVPEGRGVYEDTPGFCKSTTLDEVKAQDYKLTPGIYVGTEDEEDDGIPFEEKMEKLKKKLQEQFEKSLELQKTITGNLNSL
jgi:type I restriction enzyme M protein